MSIPKEPRQLMINLMYLVLTAMLALNVSAEIINAFFALDKGNQDAIALVSNQLDAAEASVDELLDDDSKRNFKPISPAIDDIRLATKTLIADINTLRDQLIDEGGNKNGVVDEDDYIESHGKKVPKGKKDKDLTTRLLVDGGKGNELEQKIEQTRQHLIQLYTNLIQTHGKAFELDEKDVAMKIASLDQKVTLAISEEWKESEKKSWADFKFRQMPLAAVLPLLSQIQSNAKTTEAALVNDLVAVAGGKVVKFDAFFPVINAKKAYVIEGEPFQAELSIGTYSSQLNPENIQLTVNGSPIKVGADGKAAFTQTARGSGKKTLRLGCKVTNPLTNEVTSGESVFEYEVGRRSASVAADKMNVFYIGVDNPITVSAAGVPSAQLNVSCSGAKMTGSGTKRIVRPTQTGKATITLSGGGLERTDFEFRVKRIPDPVIFLGNKQDGFIGSGEMKAQLGLLPKLPNFDFGATCKVQSYTLFYTPKRQEAVELKGAGARFSGQVANAVRKARPGDSYAFTNVKVKCPGDTHGRRVNGVAFTIR